MHTGRVSLDPRPPQPSATVIPSTNGDPPVLAMISTMGDMTAPIFNRLIDAIADKMIEKLDAREAQKRIDDANSALQSLP